jgi:hypothetical protein
MKLLPVLQAQAADDEVERRGKKDQQDAKCKEARA